MRVLVVFIFLLVAATTVSAQRESTTFILLRHAERADDGSKDPEISDAGKARAQKLAQLLAQTKVDAIYSTPYKRTTLTVTPLAESKQLKIENYDPMSAQLVDDMLKKHKGGTVVICGHSNTIPANLNLLTGTTDYKNFDDTDFGNVVIVTLAEKGNAKITWLRY
jgi:2,3-bisphosphoglycerate-dependent phosphoglycerate mutase